MNKSILYLGGFELPDKNAAAQRVMANAKLLREMGFDDCKERAVRIYSAMYLYMSLMDGSSDRESVIESFEKILDQELKEGVLWKKRQ